MSVSDGVTLGIAAAQLMAGSGRTVIQPGLTAREFDEVEQRYGFEFADDHRAFLAEGLPVWTDGDDHPDKTTDLGWPDWRNGDPGRLRAHLDFALENALWRIEAGGYWHPWWPDQRPDDPTEAVRIARTRLADDGPLVPLYIHRYLPAGRGQWGHPVLSVWGVDVIYYGNDLVDYIDHEFISAAEYLDPEADPPRRAQPAPRSPGTFWTQLADRNASRERSRLGDGP